MVGEIFTFLILSFVVYRVTHLVLMDSILEEPRNLLMDRLVTVEVDGVIVVADPDHHPILFQDIPYWRRKAYELIHCPFCFSVHVAYCTVILHNIFVLRDEPNLPMPIWYWVALAAVSVLWWKIIDGEE